MKKIAFLFTITIFLVFIPNLSLAFSCSISTSCSGITVFKISSLTNAHAEFSNQTNYGYYVCCNETGLGNSCSGNYTRILKLSSSTNAHVEKKTYTNYPDSNAICLSISNGNIDCQYSSDCSTLGSNYICLVSISSDTNAHVGDCNAYSTKVCCAVSAAPPPTQPDLIIEDIWNVGSTIYYRIKNQGGANAGASTSKLWVDGVEKATDSVGSLAAGASSDESFATYSWSCSGASDTIKVCADVGNAVSESNENNNCREETWDCGAPPTCSGSISLTLNPSTVTPGGSVQASTSGLSNCDGKTVYVRKDSCAGDLACSCSVSGSGCSCNFNAPTTVGTYTYYACIDKNNDGDFADSGESDSKTLTVTPPPADCAHSYSCTCTNWQNSVCVGNGIRKQVRDCTPDGCLSEERTVNDYTCYSDQTYKCLNGNAIDCSTTDCAICGCASGYVCESGVCNKYEYYYPSCQITLSGCNNCGCPNGGTCDASTGVCRVDNTTYTPTCTVSASGCNNCGCPQGGVCLANGYCKKLVDSYTPAPCADQSKCSDSTCYDNYCASFGEGKFYCVASPTNWYVTTRDDYCDFNGCLRDWNGDRSKNNMDIYCSGFCSPPPESTAREEDRLEKARWGQDNNRDACIYCGGGNWISDSSRFESGTTPYCCGNNAGEYYLYRKCIRPETCDSDTSDVACCNAATDCVWNGRCYSSGDYHPIYDQCVYCSSGTWVSRPCGEHCRSWVGICSGGQNCWTKFGYQDGCPYLDCEVPTPPTGYIRSWVETNCGRTCTYILYPYYNYPTRDQDSVCGLTRCEKTTLWTTPTATWSIVYPKSPSEYTYKAGDYVEIKATISVSPSGFTPLLECRLKKFNKNNEFVGGIEFDSWVKAPFPREITFRYKIKPNCEFCEKYHGATCSNCLGSDQSYGSQTKACWNCTGGDSIAQLYCSEGCDPSGNWVVDYCVLPTDFYINEGWNLQADYTDRTFCVSTLVVPG